jgi:hypothetical protein
MAQDFRWHWIAPRFREGLIGRVARDRVEVGDGSIDVPGGPLVEAGCVAETRLRRGALVAATTVEALVAASRVEELRRCAEEGAGFMRLAGHADPALVYLMILAFGDTQHVRAKLRAGDLLANAKAWKHLLGDLVEAEKCLRDAESKASSSLDFIAVAEAWGSVKNDAADLRRCLGAAEGRAATLDDVLAVAVAWSRLGDDVVSAQRGIDRARAKEDSTRILIPCARAWRLLGDEAAAKKTLAEAEARADGGADLAACASGHLDIFGDEAAFRRCLDQATQVNGWRWVAAAWKDAGDTAAARATLEDADQRADSETLAGVADAWKNLMGEADRGRRSLGTAESRATGTRAWAAAAAGWKRIFSDDNEMKRCLGEMEKHAKETLEWCECADYSAEAGDTEGARRCLASGQEKAQASADFVALARVWQKLSPGAPEVVKNLGEADAKAADVTMLVAAASAWHELLADGERARAALTRAESDATGGWSSIAHAWVRVLGDMAAARRCLGEAEKHATDAAHWTALGAAFDRILEDEAESRRCRVTAMEIQAGGDVSECARGWRRILDDDEARRRLKARETSAAGVEAWEKLAAAWKSVFDDESEAHRCDEWVGRWRTVQTAMDARDWTAYARTWREILPEENEARARLKTVEEGATSLSDWTAFARAWKRVFDDDAEARRCMAQAESKARFKSDWKTCGEAWRDLGQYADAQRCSDHR